MSNDSDTFMMLHASPTGGGSDVTPSTPKDYDYPALDAVEPGGQIIIIVMYSLTALLSFLGNTTVIVVLIFGKRSSRGIRHFLINLAISDVVMAVFCIPFTYTSYMLGRWIFYPGFCSFVQVMQHVAVTVSVYTLTAIGVDRYYAIMHPLKCRWTKSKWLVVVVAIWVMAFSFSSVLFVYGSAKPFYWAKNNYYECQENFPTEGAKIYNGCVFVLTFALPLVVLGFTYASIGWKMWKHSSPGNADAERDLHQLKAKRKVIKMLAVVVMLFAICWLPMQIFTMLVFLAPKMMGDYSKSNFNDYNIVYFSFHWLAMSNSFANPIVYCFMNENFWGDLRHIFFDCSQILHFRRKGKYTRRPGHPSTQSTTYVLSFRTTSGCSSAAVHMKKVEPNGVSVTEDCSTRYTTSEKAGYV